MRILLVTGKLAAPIVREIVSKTKTKHSIDIIELPVSAIALLSTEQIATYLKRLGIKRGDYDLVIVPGMCRGSANAIREAIGIPAVKGTIHAYDIPLILGLDNPHEELSPDKSADEIIATRKIELAREILKNLEEKVIADKQYVVSGKLLIPLKPPPFRVLAEISNAFTKEYHILTRAIERYIEYGVDAVILGSSPHSGDPDRVRDFVKKVRKDYDIAIGIDSLNPREIAASLSGGVDIVLSIDNCNYEKLVGVIREYDIAVVAIPYDSCRGELLGSPHERISYLEKLIKTLREQGVEKVIGDIVLEIPVVGRFLESVYAYRVFREKNPDTPLLMGLGNVYELVDADSIGINMLLVLLALDAGVSLLLGVEESAKAWGAVKEIVIASQMTSIAHTRSSPPKDLGLDLLVVKDKRRYETLLEKPDRVVDVKGYGFRADHIDRAGVFKIRVNREEGLVEALHIGPRGKTLVKSPNIDDIMGYIADHGMVTDIKHALYLGRELAKASEALVLGKNYIQEKPLFTSKKPLCIEKTVVEER
ncbi:MAG: dihydropteroate synthase-like protein [Thermoprotei archaeon]